MTPNYAEAFELTKIETVIYFFTPEGAISERA